MLHYILEALLLSQLCYIFPCVSWREAGTVGLHVQLRFGGQYKTRHYQTPGGGNLGHRCFNLVHSFAFISLDLNGLYIGISKLFNPIGG